MASLRLPAMGIAVAAALAGLLPVALLAVVPSDGPDVGPPRLEAAAGEPGANLSPIAFTGVSPGAASLGWVRSLDLCFREYELAYSSAGPLGPWTPWATYTDVNTASAYVYGFTPGTSVWWRLTDRACDGTEAPTEVVVPHPAAATLSYAQVDATTLSFSWDNHATYSSKLGFGRYELLMSVNGGAWSVAATILDPGTRSHTLQDVSSTTGYAFYLLTTDVCRDCPSGAPPSRTSSNTVSFGSPQVLGARAEASRASADVGQTIAFQCAASGGSPPYAYAWTFGDGGTAADPDASHAYSEPGPMRATCTARDGASATTTSSVEVAVSSAPAVVASVDHPAAAPGTVLTFTMTASGGPGTFTRYDWTFGDGDVGLGASTTHAYVNPGSYAASAIVTDANGGTASDYVVVSITDVAIDAESSTTGAAPGETINFTASASGGGGGPYAFEWDFDDGTTGTGPAVGHAYAAPGDYMPHVSALDSLGGRGEADLPTIGVGGSVQVVVGFAPDAPLAREPVDLRAFPRGGAGGYTCTWSFGDGTTGQGCEADHAWASEGTYAVTATATDRAGESAVGATQVTVHPPLSVLVEQAPPSPGVGEDVSFVARPQGGVGPYACRWTFEGSGPMIAGCQASYAWDAPGTYAVSIVVNDTEGHGLIVTRSVWVGPDPAVGAFGMNPLVPIGAVIAAGVALQLWRVRRSFTKRPDGPGPDRPDDLDPPDGGSEEPPRIDGEGAAPAELESLDEWIDLLDDWLNAEAPHADRKV
ncbi:MAG TPA: PKD domain-containing protein [Thermoplasmata archaeon]|nr:PKD domain-containing protein [Thermoplasmata archaeon]